MRAIKLVAFAVLLSTSAFAQTQRPAAVACATSDGKAGVLTYRGCVERPDMSRWSDNDCAIDYVVTRQGCFLGAFSPQVKSGQCIDSTTGFAVEASLCGIPAQRR